MTSSSSRLAGTCSCGSTTPPGDAAGQNLTGRATLRACAWIRAHYPGIREFYLEANLATDKKSSQVNVFAAGIGRGLAQLGQAG
jgi:hydroxymethylglutaryl-CoA reductase (NADPH)